MAETVNPFSVNLTLVKLGACLSVAALIGGFASYRFREAGKWLPTIPDRIGLWDSVDAPIASDVIRGLGNPQSVSKIYFTPFQEQVQASVMSAGPFENYHDPMVCVAGGGGFFMTSRKTFRIDGPKSGLIRAMIFKRRDSEARMLMYYWQQNRNGSTDTAARMGSYRDILARLDTGIGAVLQGNQTCLMRIYAMIPEDDHNGEQTQRNVEEISRTLYHQLRREGGVEQ